MRKASVIALLMAPALVTGCSKPMTDRAAAPPGAASTASSADAAKAADAGKDRARQAPISVPLLAYSHSYAMELPGQEIRSLVARHEQVCADAGPTVCQVLGADVRDDQGEINATLKLQAQPTWLSGFRARLDNDAAQAGGKVKQSATETEDLSRSIVDTEAAIRAKVTLRDRLQKLLASRPGKLNDLLQVERELAEVQGQIDAANSELAVMKTRVQTSVLTIDYRAFAAPVSGRAAEPLKRSVNGAYGLVIKGLAVIVSISAVLAPFFIVGVPVWLFIRWRLRKPVGGRRPQLEPAD